MRIGHLFRRHSALGVLFASGVLSGCGANSTTPGDDRVADASATESTSGGAGSRSANAAPGAGVDSGTSTRAGDPAGVDPGNSTAPGIPADDAVDAGPSASPADDGVDAGSSSGASAPSGAYADAGLGTGMGVPAGPGRDAGLISGPLVTDSGGSLRPCEEDAVRCSPESGQREVCEAGEWVEQDFVCATSVRVNATEGIPCAVKADGSSICWWGRDQYRALDYAMPEVSGAVHSLEYVVYSPSGSTSAAVLTRDGILVDPLLNQIEDVVQFEPSRYDVCWVTEDGSAACSEFGPLTSPATQVAIDMQRRCALLRDGSVVCHIDGAEPVTLTGHYTAIDIGSYIVCGIELGGGVTCTDLQDDTLTPWSRLEGTYTRLAVNDLGVCAMLEGGKLECVSARSDTSQPTSTYASQPTGTYTDLDAGDATVCAIRIDGSIECWQTRTASPDEMWFIPEGW